MAIVFQHHSSGLDFNWNNIIGILSESNATVFKKRLVDLIDSEPIKEILTNNSIDPIIADGFLQNVNAQFLMYQTKNLIYTLNQQSNAKPVVNLIDWDELQKNTDFENFLKNVFRMF